MKEKREFKLSSEKIKCLEKKYKQKARTTKHWEVEEKILNYSGKKELGYKEVKEIVKWKASRISKRFNAYWQKQNDKIQRITKEAFKIIKDKEDDQDAIKKAIDKLCELKAKGKGKGVGVPISTAILMSYNKEKFTVMDWRVWNILFLICHLKELYPKNIKSNHYYLYLKVCRDLANNLGVGLRTLDRALWISSKNYDC